MKLRHLVAAFAALGFTAVGSAAEQNQGVSAQLSYLQAKVAKMEEQVNKSATAAISSPSTGGAVTFDRELSAKLLGFASGAGTEMFLLDARHNGMVPNSLYLGGLLRASANYTSVTVAGTAPIAVKSDTVSTSSLTVPAAKLMFVGNINDFTTGVVELNGASGTAVVSQAYMLLGNLDTAMYFGTVGKKIPTFGNFSTYNTSFEPHTRTFFAPGSTDQASVGLSKDGATFVATAMNGGSPASNLYTNNSSRINNYAVDFKFEREFSGADVRVGAGYLHGHSRAIRTITMNSGTTAGSIASSGSGVGAWGYNAGVTFDSFGLSAEYLTADRQVNSKSLYAYDFGAQYLFQFMGKDSDAHLDYSAYSQDRGGNIGQGTNSQWVLGLNHHCAENFQMGLEYARNHYEIGSPVGSDFNVSSVAWRVQANF